ncbi:MAG: cyclopropane-fatty-acyl-phospholipid synthase [Burkholderiales bacterium]|nr:cyclopropane-fatty-acyl-phospholipid synthase [Burkholderiales bacterium]
MPTPAQIESTAHCDLAIRIFERLLHGFEGKASLRLWNDRLHTLGVEASAFTLVLRDPALLRKLITAKSPVLLADAYFRGQVDVEGDLYSALALKGHFEALALPWRDKLSLLLEARRLPAHAGPPARASSGMVSRIADKFTHKHSRVSDQAAIAFHYDVSNDFYGLWLDEQRVYSCAYFETPEDTLDQAQRNKLEHICRKLRLQPHDRMLDIGCGWGALVCWAAQHHGVHAHGITLSQQQFDYASARVAAQGLQHLVTVELRDYRDLQGHAVYDKVASVGMFEHVGLANMPTYLATVQRVLRPGGLFLNHGITHDEEGWNQTVATEFINRYVFPDGEFDCVSNIQLGMERAGFEIEDVEALRRHYALTLRHWVQRLEANRDAALQQVDEPTFRVWRLYMAACALEFEAGGTGIYQILASRRGAETALPLTRQDLYERPATTEMTESAKEIYGYFFT